MIRTSNFGLCGTHPDAVSISGYAPDWFQGPQYRKLAPKLDFFTQYKLDHDTVAYTKQFNARVLGVLEPEKVFADLDNKILLCYERPGLFCHRRLVAGWMETELGVLVPEVDPETMIL
jgi:hypothetical protein